MTFILVSVSLSIKVNLSESSSLLLDPKFLTLAKIRKTSTEKVKQSTQAMNY